MSNQNDFLSLSQAFADAAEIGGAASVLVNARRRFPATGVVFQPGLVLTADHVLEREEDLTVVFPDGAEAAAEIAGRDPGSDLAVLKLPSGAGLDPIAPAETPRVGELVLALGRPSTSGLQASLGVVSGIRGVPRMPHRRHRRPSAALSGAEFIYTDAVPYPGFSGGPLINAAGQMLGLNTSGLVQGISLAVPAARALQIAAALVEHGSIKRGYLGIRSQLTPLDAGRQAQTGGQETGLLVVWVEADSPAAAGGLLVGDIVTRIGDQPTDDHESLQAALTGDVVGKETAVEVLRGDRKTTLLVTIGERSG